MSFSSQSCLQSLLIGHLPSLAWQQLVAMPSGDLEILQLVSTSNFKICLKLFIYSDLSMAQDLSR